MIDKEKHENPEGEFITITSVVSQLYFEELMDGRESFRDVEWDIQVGDIWEKGVTNLLAEVKRWHKVRDYILEKASYPTVKKLHLKDLLNFMEEVKE